MKKIVTVLLVVLFVLAGHEKFNPFQLAIIGILLFTTYLDGKPKKKKKKLEVQDNG